MKTDKASALQQLDNIRRGLDGRSALIAKVTRSGNYLQNLMNSPRDIIKIGLNNEKIDAEKDSSTKLAPLTGNTESYNLPRDYEREGILKIFAARGDPLCQAILEDLQRLNLEDRSRALGVCYVPLGILNRSMQGHDYQNILGGFLPYSAIEYPLPRGTINLLIQNKDKYKSEVRALKDTH